MWSNKRSVKTGLLKTRLLAPRSPKPRSLFRRLVLGFVLVVLVVWAGAIAHIALKARDHMVHDSIAFNKAEVMQAMLGLRAYAGQDAVLHATAIQIEDVRLDMYKQLGYLQPVHMVVWQDQRLIYDNTNATNAVYPTAIGAVPITPEGWIVWVEHDAATGITIERSAFCDAAYMFTYSAAGFWLTPLVYSLPFLLLPAWFIVRVGLRPLRTMVALIEQRSATDLAALPDSLYRELSPLVDAINGHMKRLRSRIEREQEFLSDAAHELKTPLAVIQLNAHLLDDDPEAVGRRRAGAGLRMGVARASHTVHQLLAFERVQAEPLDQHPQQLCLDALLRDRLAMAAPLAMQRNIDIELHAEQACSLPLHLESTAAMLDNIISNAIKYSPDAGRIDVQLDLTEHGVRLAVNDQGPGIAPALRDKVFERFYRVPGQDEAGSGLGLAIAERAAARNGAAIRLCSGAGGRGLAVVIEFSRQA